MASNITSGVYATSFSTRTRDGKTYYWVYGWRLGRKVYRWSATDFDGSSTNPAQTIGWCDYVSEAAYNRLSPVMKEAFDASDHRVAKDGALIEIPMGEGYFMLGLKSDLVYDPAPPLICNEGEKRGKETCWDGSVIHKEVCSGNEWVPTGETCPTMPAHGTKRNPTTCWDGSVIYAEKFDANLKRWVPTGETPPPKPECTEGDKKAGYVCVAGKWKEVTVIEPVVEPEVEEAAATIAELEAAVVAARTAEERLTALAALASAIAAAKAEEKPCYVKCVLPILDQLPGIPCQPWIPILPGFKRSDKP